MHKIGTRGIAIVLLALAAHTGGVRADDPELAEFVVARSRIEKRVTASGLLRNRTGAEIGGIVAVLECLDAGSVVKTSEPFRRSSLAKGRSFRIAFTIPKCPAFSSYRVRIKAREGEAEREWIWVASGLSEAPLPVAGSRRPAQLSLASQSVAPSGAPGEVTVRCRVRNDGELPSRRAAARIRFFGADDLPAHERTLLLGSGTIGPGEERDFEFELAAVPAHARAQVELVQPEGIALQVPGGEFSDEPRVDAAEFRFEKTGESQILVAGQVRNGLGHRVRNILLTVVLEGDGGAELKRDDVRVPGPLYPGEVTRFAAVLDDLVAFVAYRYEMAYEVYPEHGARPRGDEVAPEEFPGAPAGGETIDVGAGEEGTEATSGPPGKSAARSIGLVGLHVVQGKFVGQGKSMTYTGDLLMLKVRFLDEQGKPVKQPGKLEVLFTQSGKSKGKVTRPVPDGVWKLDLRGLKETQLGDQTVAWDSATGLVHVGLMRWKEDAPFAWAMDVRFTSKEKELWTFRRLEEPYESEPQAADPAKKR